MEDGRQALDEATQVGSQPYDVASMPGFRFQPTEEELVGFYLRSMVIGNRLEVELINVLDLYRYDPWELPALAFMQGEREWLFFCPRDKKYPNGARPNRVTASGYWKATGTDRPVRRAQDSRCIGLKKTLVFYTGKAPKGRKTEWIMNEYRLPHDEQRCQSTQNHRKGSNNKVQKEVALCRIYKKPAQSPSMTNLFADVMTEGLGLGSSDFLSTGRDDLDTPQNSTVLCRMLGEKPCASDPRSDRQCPTSPSTKPVLSLKPSKRPIADEMETFLHTEATNLEENIDVSVASQQAIMHVDYDTSLPTQSFKGRSVKLKTELTSRMHPILSVANSESVESVMSAQLMQAESSRRARSLFVNSSARGLDTAADTCRSNVSVFMSTPGTQLQLEDQEKWFWPDQECIFPGEVFSQPACNTHVTLSSIDRLLKASMWSPLPSPSTAANDDDNGSTSFANQFSWYSQPSWQNAPLHARQPLLHIPGHRPGY